MAVNSQRLTWQMRIPLLLLLTLGGAVFLGLVASNPPGEHSYYPRCQFHQFTGWHCPGCGSTRALHSFLNGQIHQALAYNSLAFVVIPTLAVAFVQSVLAWNRRELVNPEAPRRRFWKQCLVILVVAFGVLRNLPWEPFVWMAPHELVINQPTEEPIAKP